MRAFCRDRGIVYQGFSLLTANLEVLRHPLVGGIAARAGATPAQVVFRFAQAVGMLPLTGTSDAAHMTEDLASPPPDALPRRGARDRIAVGLTAARARSRTSARAGSEPSPRGLS